MFSFNTTCSSVVLEKDVTGDEKWLIESNGSYVHVKLTSAAQPQSRIYLGTNSDGTGRVSALSSSVLLVRAFTAKSGGAFPTST